MYRLQENSVSITRATGLIAGVAVQGGVICSLLLSVQTGSGTYCYSFRKVKWLVSKEVKRMEREA
jgi:uncharacterized protein (DUF2062 family)